MRIVSAEPVPAREPKTLRLFCLPYAAGPARIFRGWHPHLPRFVEICPIELPGHGRRSHEEPLGELEPIMSDLLATVLRRTDLPIAILGCDYGAVLGFELAHRLEHHYGIAPRHLFVASMRAPVWPPPVNPVSELPDGRFRELLRRPDGSVGDLVELDSLIATAIRVVRADLSVADNYRYTPEAMLSCPITAFRGRYDTGVSAESVQAWNACTAGAFRLHEMPGGHFFMHSSRARFLYRLSMELGDYAEPASDAIKSCA